MAYFAASVDTAEENRRFAEHVEADYPILADPSKETAAAYGVLGRLGFASRWTFYIGPDGKILEIDSAVSVKTAGEDIAKKLAALGVANAALTWEAALARHEAGTLGESRVLMI